MIHAFTERDRNFLAALRIDPGESNIVTDPELASREEVERLVASSGWCDCEKCRALRGGGRFDDVWREFRRRFMEGF